MGRIVVSQFVSADGVIEDPVGMETLGRGSWTSHGDSGPEGERFKLDEVLASEAMLLGRRTYDAYTEAWPPRDGAYADKLNGMPKFVVSSTLQEPPWQNSTVLRGDVLAEVTSLKQRTQGDILVQGSAQLVDALLEDDVVDQWRLMVFPIVVGTGKRCFGDPGQSRPLRLIDARAVGEGVAILVYEPDRAAKPGN
jgi:dihydrofolate reductase